MAYLPVVRHHQNTMWKFLALSQMNIPIIAHEIGQWPVYPEWNEIDKYAGVLKARNFEEITPNLLSNYDILIVKNATSPFSQAEIHAIN